MLPPVLHSSKDFSYSASSNCFTAEASDFGSREPFNSHYGKEGFVLVSAKTGLHVMMLLEKIDKDRDGDIQGWRFVARMESKKTFGTWKATKHTFKALIIND